MPTLRSHARSNASIVFSSTPPPCSPRWAKDVPRQSSARRERDGAIMNSANPASDAAAGASIQILSKKIVSH